MKKFYHNSTHYLSITHNTSNYNSISEFELSLLEKNIKSPELLELFKNMKASMSAMKCKDSTYNPSTQRYFKGDSYKSFEGSSKEIYFSSALPQIEVKSIDTITETSPTKVIPVTKLKLLKNFSSLAHDFLRKFDARNISADVVVNQCNWYYQKTSSYKTSLSLEEVATQFKKFVTEFDRTVTCANIEFDDYTLGPYEIQQKTSDYSDNSDAFYIIAKDDEDVEGFLCLNRTQHSGDQLYRYAITKNIKKALIFKEIPDMYFTLMGRVRLKINYDFVETPKGTLAQEVDTHIQKEKLQKTITSNNKSRTHKL